MFNSRQGGDEGITLALCACDAIVSTQTSHARFRLLIVEPKNFVLESNPKFIINDKNKKPKRAFNFCGGDEFLSFMNDNKNL